MQILDKAQTLKKINRIAFEIYENNYEETEVLIAGIDPGGYRLAALICNELKEIASFDARLLKISLDKDSPTQSQIEIDHPLEVVKDKVIILVDDVQNSGRTLAYSLKPFLNTDIKRLQTALMVVRGHDKFPIHADYVGYELSTTLLENVKVVLEGDDFGVYLD